MYGGGVHTAVAPPPPVQAPASPEVGLPNIDTKKAAEEQVKELVAEELAEAAEQAEQGE